MRLLLISAIMFFSFGTHAMNNTLVGEVLKAQGLFDAVSVQPQGLNWTVGDNAQYSIKMGFLQGTMDMKVREKVAQGYWIEQDIDLGFAGKQLVEIIIDPNTGEIIELRVNGQKQQPPDSSGQEVVEMKEDRVTVPAGTFDCVYLRVKDTSNNQESQAWLNPEEIPVMGLIKNISPSQFGDVTVELTGYEKK